MAVVNLSDSMTQGFCSFVQDRIDEGLEVDDAIRQAMRAPECEESVVSALAGVFRGFNRNITRVAEVQASENFERKEYRSAKQVLIGATFALPTGRNVEWLKATSEEHRLRATWQRNRGLSIIKNADLHDQVANLLDELGVKNLGEIESIEKYSPEIAAAAYGKKEIES